ncbi:MAG: zf-HC2 domain-containing protein [Acidobacteria bacterium]|nr:zf-HC2 domain-containing protein [Acidobacteriota bacterium]
MTRCRELEEHLSLYVDDLLDPAEAAEVRTHLDTCPACAGLVTDLSRIASTARLLGPIAPPAHVYTALTSQLPRTNSDTGGQGPAPGRPHWRWAAVAATLVATAGLAYIVGGRTASTPPAAPAAATTRALDTIASELELAVHHYEQAIREFDTVATAADTELAPDVAASVRRSLRALDTAIAESRQALETDPASEPARISLFEALRRKIDLLQTTALIVNESQGSRPAEPAGPANATGREL